MATPRKSSVDLRRPAKKGPTKQINIRLRPLLYDELTRFTRRTKLSKTETVELALKRLFGIRLKS